MTGKEKIYFLLGCIQDVRETSASGQPLKIDPMNDLYGKYQKEELSRIFAKLEQDDHILKVLKTPSGTKTIDFVEGIIPDEPVPENDDGLWHIELIQPAFNDYYSKIQQEPEYQEFTGKKPTTTPQDKVLVQPSQPAQQNSDIVYEVTYTQAREIMLNKVFQLAKPDFDTENDLVFNYLYKNPNQKFTKQQLEEAIGRQLTKDLHKIVENLGFKADLRKMFFSVSATSISFKNPITQEDLEALGIQKIKIS